MKLSSLASRIPPSETLAMNKLAQRMAAEGREVIAFSKGEPDFDTPEHVAQKGCAAIREGRTKYTPSDGLPELKQAVAHKFVRDNGLIFTDDQIITSAGLKPIIYGVMLSTLNPGDEVLLPAPYWVSYPALANMVGAKVVSVPGEIGNGFRLTPAMLAAAISEKTRLLILNTPCNPTGAMYSADELSALADVVRQHPQIIVLADEIYDKIWFDNLRPVSFATIAPDLMGRTVTCNGMSKGYAMTGWRIGFAGGPQDIIRAAAKFIDQMLGSASMISQLAAQEALMGDQSFIDVNRLEFQRRRDIVVRWIEKIPGLNTFRPQGAFYIFVDCSKCVGKRTSTGVTLKTDAVFVAELLRSKGVATVHGSAFGLSPYIRISYALSDREIETGMKRLRSFCSELT